MEYFFQCILSVYGLLLRYYTNTNFSLFDDLQNVKKLYHYFRTDKGAFQLIFLYNFFSSIFYGKKSVQNPWNPNTLEWACRAYPR
jgi:cytochrome c oxidase subunit 1